MLIQTDNLIHGSYTPFQTGIQLNQRSEGQKKTRHKHGREKRRET